MSQRDRGAGPQGPVCRLRPPLARSPGGRVFTPPPPQGPAVAGGRVWCGRFLFRFQGAYVKGAAVDSPCADGYTHERPPRVGRLGLHQRQPAAVGLAGCAASLRPFVALALLRSAEGGKFDPLPFRRVLVVDRAFLVFAFVTAIFHTPSFPRSAR